MAVFRRKKQAGVWIYNRETGCLEEEAVFEKGFMDLFYGTAPGRLMTRALLSRRTFSRIYGRLQKRPGSARRIRPFIEKYNINIEELERPPEYYRNFNDFFKRKLKPGARPVKKDRGTLISPADGRLLAYKLKKDLLLPVKGLEFHVGELLGGYEAADPWLDGTCLKIRLAPSDYHRFCYIDSGFHGPATHVNGRLHSVSPLALGHQLKILHGNDREYMVLDTDNFGRVAHVDIGAMAVGRIHQHFRQGGEFSKGEEKGYFEFGGSTIILLFEPGRIVIDEDILEYSEKGIEALVRYGSQVGRKAEGL